MISHRCACGGTITAPSLDESAPYVEAHNLTRQHQAWRAAGSPMVALCRVTPEMRLGLPPRKYGPRWS